MKNLNRSRLNRKPKTYASLKAKTWLSVLIVILTVSLFVVPLYYFNTWSKTLDVPQVYAQSIKQEYKIPTLNPNETEREQNIGLIKKIWGKDQTIGLEIARCESGYRTKGPHVANTNSTVDQGVFSINSVHGMPEMENAVANISYAYLMFKAQGTTPWDSSKHCWN